MAAVKSTANKLTQKCSTISKSATTMKRNETDLKASSDDHGGDVGLVPLQEKTPKLENPNR